MAGQCCAGEGRSLRRVRRFFGAGAPVLPGAVLVLLPKCPLCLAAWVAACTGIALPAAVTVSVRPALVIACALSGSLVVVRAVASLRLTGAMPFGRVGPAAGAVRSARQRAS